MRRHLQFGSTIVALLTFITYLLLALRQPNSLNFFAPRTTVQNFLQEFKKTHRPLTELNLSKMYGGSGQFQILHPIFAIKSLSFDLTTPTCKTAEIENSESKDEMNQCGLELKKATQSIFKADLSELTKQHEFEQILKVKHASSQFISTPPFIAETGKSYAYLLTQENISPFNNSDWIKAHLSFFKVSELKEILKRYEITSPDYEVIASLTEPQIKLLVEGSTTLLTFKYLFIKNESRLAFSPLSYWVYDVRSLRAHLHDQEYDLVPYTSNTHCLERLGNTCWTYSSKAALTYVYKYSVAFTAFSTLIIFALIFFYWRYISNKNREQRRSQVALQVLSHEFRTPVSVMLLLIEDLSKNLSRLNETDQDTITKFSAEAFRLQRIIEMSKTYLQSAADTNRFNFSVIESINSWIENLAADFDSRLHCSLLSQDQSIKADPFWLSFILSNLVQNAFAHGKEPVHIHLKKISGKLEISVEDSGHCEFDSLNKMSEAFSKSKKSKGMGLGLSITSAIVREWGGQIKFKKDPTTFSIAFRPDLRGSIT